MVHMFVIVYEFVEYVCGVYDYLFKCCVAGWDITYCANMYAHGPQSGPFRSVRVFSVAWCSES